MRHEKQRQYQALQKRSEIDSLVYEITLSFSNLRINVYKCLIRMDMDMLYIICRDQNGIAKAKNILSDINPESKLGKLVTEKARYGQIKEFLEKYIEKSI